MTFEMLVALSLLLLLANFIYLYCTISKLKTRIHMLDDVYTRKENAAAAVRVLEGTIRKLNSVYKDHERRLDILESGHPDSDIDYGTVDDDGNSIEVWFNGKKYVPEDKQDEDTTTLYADNKVVAETTRPEETRCCATCRHYRPGPDHTCTIRPWLHVTKEYATMADSACNNYEKAYTPTKGEDDECDELLKRVERLNRIYDTGLMSLSEYGERLKELMHK